MFLSPAKEPIQRIDDHSTVFMPSACQGIEPWFDRAPIRQIWCPIACDMCGAIFRVDDKPT
jgi:hypothetical protein